MKNPFFFVSKYLLLAALSVTMLAACGESLESPETVMNKAKEAVVEVDSGKIEVTAKAEGQNGTDDLLFTGEVEMVFDKQDRENKKMDLHVSLSGDLKAGEKELNGDFDLNLLTLAEQYYVKLNKLESSDESITQMKPFIDMYKGKWLKIAEDFVPEDIRDLQGEDEAMRLKKKQLEDLFVETKLFDVVKEYGVEKLNGEKVYHYGVKPNIEGFKDYMTKAAIIDGRELTLQEVEEAVEVLTYVKNAELYIDVDDYYVLKSVLQFTGEALSEEADANLEVEIVIEGSDYNKSVTVKAPADAEDFNPLNLVMGLGALSAMPDDTGGTEVVEEGVTDDASEETEAVAE